MPRKPKIKRRLSQPVELKTGLDLPSLISNGAAEQRIIEEGRQALWTRRQSDYMYLHENTAYYIAQVLEGKGETGQSPTTKNVRTAAAIIDAIVGLLEERAFVAKQYEQYEL